MKKISVVITILFLISFTFIIASAADVEYIPLIWEDEFEADFVIKDYDHYKKIIFDSQCGMDRTGDESIENRRYWDTVAGPYGYKSRFDPDGVESSYNNTDMPVIYELIRHYNYTKEAFVELNAKIDLSEKKTAYFDENEIMPRFFVHYEENEYVFGEILYFTDYQIDVLFSNDISLIKLTFKSPDLLYDFNSGNLYTYSGLKTMTDAELAELKVDIYDLQQWNEIMDCVYVDHQNGYVEFKTDYDGRNEVCERVSENVQVIDYTNSSPQTGFATVAYAAVAVVSAAAAVAVGKKRRG